MVLLVDPDLDSRIIFSTILEHRGIRVVVTGDPEEALHLARHVGPGVVVLDLSVGWGTVRRFRVHDRLQDVPLALLSAVDFGAERREAERLGCSVFLSKPVRLDRLVREIRLLLGLPH